MNKRNPSKGCPENRAGKSSGQGNNKGCRSQQGQGGNRCRKHRNRVTGQTAV